MTQLLVPRAAVAVAALTTLFALSSACSNSAPDGSPAGHDSAAGAGGASGPGAPQAGSGAGGDDRDASQGPPVVVAPPEPNAQDAGRDASTPGVDAAVPMDASGPMDAGEHDAGFDAGHDAGGTDPVPTGIALGRLEVLSGASTGQGSVAGHRLRLRAGFAGARGAGAGAGYRLRLGSRR